jgi:hypothetical protein
MTIRVAVWPVLLGLLLSLPVAARPLLSTQALSPANNPEYHRLAEFRELLNRQFDQSHSVIRYILAELQARQLPASLALLPMLESSLQPDAVSPASAAGLWQLMPATARRYGLTVDQHNDERFNLHRSTYAAIRYLAFLYQKFDRNLTLTLAAYNAGEGRVQNSLKEDKYITELSLPEETVRYVQRFHALAELVNLQRFTLPPVTTPQLRLNADAATPLIPLESGEVTTLNHLFAQRITINTDRVEPLISLTP